MLFSPFSLSALMKPVKPEDTGRSGWTCAHVCLCGGGGCQERLTHTDVLLIRLLDDEGDQNPLSVFHQVVDHVMQRGTWDLKEKKLLINKIKHLFQNECNYIGRVLIKR